MRIEFDGRMRPRGMDRPAPSNVHALREAPALLPSVAEHGAANGSEPTRLPRYLALRSVRKITLLKIEDIAWVDALHNYSRLHSADGNAHMAREQISDIAERLAHEGFVRIHRSTVINLHFVREVEITKSGSYVVVMRSGQRFSVSRSRHAALVALLGAA